MTDSERQTTDLERALWGRPRCVWRPETDCLPECEYGLRGPCVAEERVKAALKDSYGETMAEYYQRRTNERGAEIERLKEVLIQALDCLNDETPEVGTREEAREDTIQKIRDVLNGR